MLELIILGIGLLFLSTLNFNQYIKRIFFYFGLFIIAINFILVNENAGKESLIYLSHVFIFLIGLIALLDALSAFGIVLKKK